MASKVRRRRYKEVVISDYKVETQRGLLVLELTEHHEKRVVISLDVWAIYHLKSSMNFYKREMDKHLKQRQADTQDAVDHS